MESVPSVCWLLLHRTNRIISILMASENTDSSHVEMNLYIVSNEATIIGCAWVSLRVRAARVWRVEGLICPIPGGGGAAKTYLQIAGRD